MKGGERWELRERNGGRREIKVEGREAGMEGRWREERRGKGRKGRG